MGWVMMSERELGRIEVLARVVDGSMSATTAASVLAVSTRHIRRMVKRFREDGAAALQHGLRGRPSNNQIRSGLREDVTRLVREHFAEILCWWDQRYVDRHLTLRYECKRIMLEQNEVTRGLVGKYVETYAFADDRLDIRWKGLSLPYSAFDDNQQHVTHAAITENKRLSEVLAYAKALQDAAPPKVKSVGKQKSRYEPTGKKSPGRSWLDKRAARRAEEVAQGTGQVSDA